MAESRRSPVAVYLEYLNSRCASGSVLSSPQQDNEYISTCFCIYLAGAHFHGFRETPLL